MASGNVMRTITGFQALILSALPMLIPLQGPVSVAGAEVAGYTGHVIPPTGSRTHAGTLPATAAMASGEAWFAAARRRIALHEYRASENAVGLQAPSRRHGFRTYFEPTGIRIVDRTAAGGPQLLALRLPVAQRARPPAHHRGNRHGAAEVRGRAGRIPSYPQRPA